MAKDKWLTRIVEITWRDACTTTRWRSRKEYLKMAEPLWVKTVGYLLHTNKTRIAVVMTQGRNNDCSESMTIPREWVQKIRRLT